jgi:hypothetical protein
MAEGILEDKRILAARMDFLSSQAPPSTTRAEVVSQSMKWLWLGKLQWTQAPLKRGDVGALLARCETAGSYTEAIRLVGLVFSDPSSLAKCFPLPLSERVTEEVDGQHGRS